MTTSSKEDNDVIFELYKLSSVTLPEKNTWSIEEISTHISTNLKLTRMELLEKIKKILKDLEDKHAIIFVNEFEAINLVEPKLRELVDTSTGGK